MRGNRKDRILRDETVDSGKGRVMSAHNLLLACLFEETVPRTSASTFELAVAHVLPDVRLVS